MESVQFTTILTVKGYRGMKSLEGVENEAWALLVRASADKRSPMRTPVISTISKSSPQSRTVVLRKIDKDLKELTLFSDVRAQKVEDLMYNPQLAWLFYHPKKQIQLRIQSSVIIHNQDELAQSHWENLPVHSRKSYATAAAPGTATAESTNGLPDIWEEGMNLSQTEYAFEHFTVIVAKVTSIEYLELGRELQRRASVRYTDTAAYRDWLIP